MSFLAPLFALGSLAVVLPIVFHLIQRRPRGEQVFSSLMFLQPSTPRISRRSRLNHLLLLALRATAVILLALAFSRPFLRALQQLTVTEPARRVVLLIDRSASMQREGLWQQAMAEAQRVLDTVDPRDEVALYTFDGRVQPVVGLGSVEEGSRTESVSRAINSLQPGWGASDLTQALATIADLAKPEGDSDQLIATHLVLISDLQQGTGLSASETFRWPPDVQLDVRQVTASPGNASLLILPPGETELAPDQLRIRVTNHEDSRQTDFQLQWLFAGDKPPAVAKQVQVAADRQRTILLDRPPGAIGLELTGDRHSFDNRLHLAALKPLEQRVWFWGDTRDQRDRLLFFLRRADLSTPRATITVESHAELAPPPDLTPANDPLVICGGRQSIEQVDRLRAYLEQGGQALIVLDPHELRAGTATRSGLDAPLVDPNGQSLAGTSPSPDGSESTSDDDASLASGIAKLCGINALQLDLINGSANDKDDNRYLLLSDIDFRHPLFAPFADPKYSDFTKIRFWNAFRLQTDHEQAWRILARFDSGEPALVEKQLGRGRCLIMTTGWHTRTSNLALSTKFVPLLASILGAEPRTAGDSSGIFVGQAIDLGNRGPYARILRPDGTAETAESELRTYANTDAPGIYRFLASASDTEGESVAANLWPAESNVTPLDPAELERRGIALTQLESEAQRMDRDRQMRDVELESQQKLWRWLLAAAIAVLAIETYVAGRANRSETASVQTSHSGPTTG
jgi:hypothetical protein